MKLKNIFLIVCKRKYTRCLYKEHVYKKHQVEISQKLRDIYETWVCPSLEIKFIKPFVVRKLLLGRIISYNMYFLTVFNYDMKMLKCLRRFAKDQQCLHHNLILHSSLPAIHHTRSFR